MKYYIFKSPRKPNDIALEVLDYKPSELVIGLRAKKFGPIEVVSEEEFLREEAK